MISTGQSCDPRAKGIRPQQYADAYLQYGPALSSAREGSGSPDGYATNKKGTARSSFLEEQTGKKMDYDRLRELVDLSDRTWNLIHETYELRKAVPCPMGTGDAMNTMVPINFMMATQDAYNFFVNLNKELKEKIAKREGEVENEKYRLLWGGGLPAWFALTDFNYFNSKGACFPAETTYRMAALSTRWTSLKQKILSNISRGDGSDTGPSGTTKRESGPAQNRMWNA
jgi:hypothetical protein